MKKYSASVLIISVLLILASCNNSNEVKNQTASSTQKSAGEPVVESNKPIPPGDGLIGSWALSLETYDDNSNRKLDSEERAKAFTNRYYYRFNEDGSCLLNFTTNSVGAFKGHYEIKPENNRQKLTVYRDEGEKPGLEGTHFIVSVNRDELVLLDAMGELTFWIFKRTKQ